MVIIDNFKIKNWELITCEMEKGYLQIVIIKIINQVSNK